jgi:hypothetical protein
LENVVEVIAGKMLLGAGGLRPAMDDVGWEAII